MRISGRPWILVLLVAATGACTPRAEWPASEPARALESATIPVDHHVHLLGPGLLRDWKSLGVPFSREDAAYLSADGLLDGADGVSPIVERVVLVPMAHLYGNSELRGALGLSATEEQSRASAENDHVAREAARHPGRAVALCSVSVLRPWAWPEIRRCRAELGSPGIKLHLANSEVDLRVGSHLAALAEIAGWAEEEGVALWVHLDPQRRGHEVKDVDRFARTVLEPHPRLTAIIAHLGGSGGYGAWTQSVFRALVDWLEGLEAAGDPRPGVRFDVSGVVLAEASEGVPPTTRAEAAALAADLRRAGLERLLFASDYPVFAPRRSAALLAERAGLTPEEMSSLLANEVATLFPE